MLNREEEAKMMSGKRDRPEQEPRPKPAIWVAVDEQVLFVVLGSDPNTCAQCSAVQSVGNTHPRAFLIDSSEVGQDARRQSVEMRPDATGDNLLLAADNVRSA